MLPRFERAFVCAVWFTLLTGLPGSGASWAGGWQAQPGSQQASRHETQSPPSLSLREQGRVHFSAPPPALLQTNMKCDQDGNIYAVYTDDATGALAQPGGAGELPVQKISSDSRSISRYALPPGPNYQLEVRIDYDVTPWGNVYDLLKAYHHWPRREHELPDLVTAKFKDDGTLDSVTKLEQPDGGYLQANLFAAFPYGGFLVTGTLVLNPFSPPAQRSGRPFTGIYDQRGQFVREVELTGDVAAGSETKSLEEGVASQQGGPGEKGQHWMLAISQGNMIGAPDGNVYLLRASNPPRLYAISAGGEVVKALTLRFDAAGLTPIGMSLAGENQALIEFGHYPTGKPSEDSKYHTVLSLVNLASGDVTGTFEAPEDVLPSACATSNDEFLFLGTSKQGTLDVVKFADSAN